MGDVKMQFEDFLSDIDPNFGQAVTAVHELLTGNACAVRLQQAKSGHVVSYDHSASKRAVANLVSRKSGPVVRIYGDHAAGYVNVLERLPEGLQERIAKAPDCKRLLDPARCNARCSMGYDLTFGGVRHQKCRYSCFMFPVDTQTLPFILSVLQQEIRARAV